MDKIFIDELTLVIVYISDREGHSISVGSVLSVWQWNLLAVHKM